MRDAGVELGSQLMTDSWAAYRGLGADYIHQTVNHAVEYVRGNVHSNGIENFWSLLKRTVRGTYVSVDPQHLNAYLGEQVFRFNTRKQADADRFLDMTERVSGKRLTYKQLIGEAQEQSA